MLNNFNIEIKRIFISFAQQLFAQNRRHTWSSDQAETDILIADKNAVNTEIIEHNPSIIISRGPYGWSETSMGQMEEIDLMDMNNVRYSDVLRGSIRYSCIARNGLVAEELGDILFGSLVGYKRSFKQKGVHSLRNINISEEQTLKTDSDIELTSVDVNVQFEMKRDISAGTDYHSIYLVDQDNYKYYQNTDFYINTYGQIVFYNEPEDYLEIQAIYINSLTLDEEEEPIKLVSEDYPTKYYVNNGIYGAPVWSGFDIIVSGVSNDV